MATFAEIMQGMQPQQSQVPFVPMAPDAGQPMPNVPGMPQYAVQPAPSPSPGPGPQASPQAPPANAVPPEELAQRQAGWKSILQGFMAQPNAQQILLSVGLKLLQGRRPGESIGQQLGGAIQTGYTANSMLDANAAADADKARLRQQQDQRFEVEQRGRIAEAGKAEYDLDFARKTEPEKREEIQIKIGNLKRQGRLDDAKLVEQEFQNGNLTAAWDLEKRLKETSMRTQQAHAKAALANAAGNGRNDPSAWELADLLTEVIPNEAPDARKRRIAQTAFAQKTTAKSTDTKDIVAQITALSKVRENAEDAQVPALDVQISELTRQLTGGGGTGTGTTAATVPAFASFGDAVAAKKKGIIKTGDVITIAGKRNRVD